jgi:serine protease AprX
MGGAVLVAVFAALAFWAPVAQGDSATAPDPGAGAANAAMDVVAGGSGVDRLAPGGTGVDVAVIDSGVVAVGGLAEPGRVIHGPDFSSEGRDPQLATLDTFGHGTHVAGVIAGHDPVTGFSGIAPGARVVSVKVADADGITTLTQVLAALDWVRRHRYDDGMNIRVVNLSFGVDVHGHYREDVLAWAVEQLWREGIAVVAAAGNNGYAARELDMPAADPFVIAAGATDTRDSAEPADDRVADFSSRSTLRPPDLVAPGTGVVSLRVPGSALDLEYPAARVGSGFFRGSGTSQAAAVVSGLAANLLSRHPGLKPDQLKALLVAGAVDLPDPRSADGAGRADLARSFATPVPSEESVRQRWLPALLEGDRRRGERDDDDDRRRGDRHYHDDDDDYRRGRSRYDHDDRETGPVNAEWAGRRWSGRRWSGRRWSGRRWSGASWIDGPGG